MEKLREVAVASLISQLSPPEPQDGESFMRSSLGRISLRRSEADKRKGSVPAVVQTSSTNPTYRPRMLRSSTTLTCEDGRGRGGRAEGQSCTVCVNCKGSLLNTISSMSVACRQSDRIIPGIKLTM